MLYLFIKRDLGYRIFLIQGRSKSSEAPKQMV